MKTFKQFLTEAKFQMVRSRDGYTKGPLPTMSNFTDYTTNYEFNFGWHDNVNSENMVKKHIRMVLDYLGYDKDEIELAVKNAKIEKYKRTYFKNEPHDKGEYLPGYEVGIKCDRN